MPDTDGVDARYLREAIALAAEKLVSGGGPFGALVVEDGRVLGRGWNRVTDSNDPTAHAEVVAIRDACSRKGSFRLDGATLYSSCEPCPMCLAAAYWARLGRVCYAATREDAARGGFADERIYDELSRPPGARSLPTSHLLREEGTRVFDAWLAKDDRIDY
jgi:guanine deaminase